MRTLRRTLSHAAIPLLMLFAATADAADDLREPLWAAARNGDATAVRTLLKKGADVNARNEIGITALWIAAGNGKSDVVEVLLEHGADVNARDGIWYQTPLSLALGGFGGDGSPDLVKRLLRAGARDVDAAAMTAAARGNV